MPRTVRARLAPPPPSAPRSASPSAATPCAHRPVHLPLSLPRLLIVVLATAAMLPAGVRAEHALVTETTDCNRVAAQSALDYNRMRGSWYVVEVAEHLPMQNPARAPVATSACPMVEVWPPAVLAPDTRLRLQWRERRNHVNYDLRLPEPNKSKGFWLVDQPQNGSLTTNEKYRQFEGAVLVMRATATHAVLTFCGNPGAERSVYSVVLAREPVLPVHDMNSINGMLEYRGLTLSGLKRTCKDFPGGSAAATPAPWLCAAAWVLAVVLARARAAPL